MKEPVPEGETCHCDICLEIYKTGALACACESRPTDDEVMPIGMIFKLPDCYGIIGDHLIAHQTHEISYLVGELRPGPIPNDPFPYPERLMTREQLLAAAQIIARGEFAEATTLFQSHYEPFEVDANLIARCDDPDKRDLLRNLLKVELSAYYIPFGY